MTKTATARAPAPSRAPFLTRTPRPEGLPEFFLSVRQAEAAKLGLRAHGNIVYQVLLDPDRQRVFLRVIANSGSGSFSDEPVLVDKLARAVADRDRSKPLRGSELQSAILGKSVCNSGFMAAVLVTEGLLGRDPAKRFDLLDLERWQTWTAEQLATPGELTEVRLKAEGIDPAKDKLVAVGKAVKAKDVVTAMVEHHATLYADLQGEAPDLQALFEAAYFKRFQVAYKRRREGKTDFRARRQMVLQDKTKFDAPKYRLVARVTGSDIVAQIVHAKAGGGQAPKHVATYSTGLLT